MNIENFKKEFSKEWDEANVFRLDNEILIKLDLFYWYNVETKEWNDNSYKKLENCTNIIHFAQPRKLVFKGTYLGTLINAFYVGTMHISDLALLFPEYNFIMEQAIKLHIPFILNAFRQEHQSIRNLNETSLLRALGMSIKQLNQFQNYIILTKQPFFYYLNRMEKLVPSFKGIQDKLFSKLLEIATNDAINNIELEFYRDNILAKPGQLKVKIDKILNYINNNFTEYITLRSSLKRINRLDEHKYPILPNLKILEELISNLQIDIQKYQDEAMYAKFNEDYNKIYPSLLKYEYQNEDYTIVVPKVVEELDVEGNQLHHCVGSYKEVISQGKEIIIFLRKKNAPKESYYTIDLDPDGFIRQIHGKYNCNLAKDPEKEKIMEFLTNWAKEKSDIVNSKSLRLSYQAVCHL